MVRAPTRTLRRLPMRHLVEQCKVLNTEREDMKLAAVLKSTEEGGFIAMNRDNDTR